MLTNFRTLDLAILFYHHCQTVKLPRHLRDQLDRASSSISLNLAEGTAKPTARDRKKFYYIAMGSLRESQTILALIKDENAAAIECADKLGAYLYNLIRATS